MQAQTASTLRSEISTEALPISLARFESVWRSSPTRSTVASIAELMSSTMSTSKTLAIMSACDVPESPSQNRKPTERGIRVRASRLSWRKASSSR